MNGIKPLYAAIIVICEECCVECDAVYSSRNVRTLRRKLIASVFVDYSLCRRSLCMIAVTRASQSEYDLWPSRNLRHALGRRCMWQASHVLYLVNVYHYAVHGRFCDVFLSLELFIANRSKSDCVYLMFNKDF